MRAKYWLVGAVIATGLSVGLGLEASASTPDASSSASGSFTFQSDYTNVLARGISSEISQLTYSGTLAGIAIDRGTENTYANGSFTGTGTEYCAACTIGDASGAFTATYIYWGSGNTYSGAETFTQGFGKLAGLVGGGSFKGNVQTNANSYEYTYSLP
ncbi:MAG TPA: hypothetical protein VEJ84_20995 [Acidimicrobiales bacterium]|nr:hypothetical protein [Acidimicrobiales bacterium]